MPGNLQTFQSAKVVLIPHAPGGAASVGTPGANYLAAHQRRIEVDERLLAEVIAERTTK